jgi:hypothetical protein
MANYAIVEDNVVTNVVVWDGQTEWAHSGQAVEVGSAKVGIGYLYDPDSSPPFVEPESEGV